MFQQLLSLVDLNTHQQDNKERVYILYMEVEGFPNFPSNPGIIHETEQTILKLNLVLFVFLQDSANWFVIAFLVLRRYCDEFFIE